MNRYNHSMQSITELFTIGSGPSSSHTIGPSRAAERFKNKWPEADSYQITLYGSLAATGKGHMTDHALEKALAPSPFHIIWIPDKELPRHPNGMLFEALDASGAVLGDWQVYSIGGGSILGEGDEVRHLPKYRRKRLTSIMHYCSSHGITFWEYVEKAEGPEIWNYLEKILNTMMDSIDRGLETEGVLPGGLGLPRKAVTVLKKVKMSKEVYTLKGVLAAYALATAEENAAGGIIVTAPTAGSAGVLPSVLRYMKERLGAKEKTLLQALATAGLIGSLIKSNASVSGAEVGCQGEIGSACAMSAAAATQILGGTVRQIEYAAEIGLEHYLGLTCDPVGGLVQIPCIERNVFAASQAIDAANYALLSDGSHRIPFDNVVELMKQTGHNMPSLYRETSTGGMTTMYEYPHDNH